MAGCIPTISKGIHQIKRSQTNQCLPQTQTVVPTRAIRPHRLHRATAWVAEKGEDKLADLRRSPEPAGSSAGHGGDLHELREGVNSKQAGPFLQPPPRACGGLGAGVQLQSSRLQLKRLFFFPTNETLKKRKRLFKVRSNSGFLDLSSKNTVLIPALTWLTKGG